MARNSTMECTYKNMAPPIRGTYHLRPTLMHYLRLTLMHYRLHPPTPINITCTCQSTHICTHFELYIYTLCTCTYTHLYICTFLSVHICTHSELCIYTLCTCTYTRLHTCTFVFVYTLERFFKNTKNLKQRTSKNEVYNQIITTLQNNVTNIHIYTFS